jgi:high-affinity iron transporter
MARRLVVAVTIAFLAVVGIGGTAHAQALDVSVKQAIVELDSSRALLDRSVELYASGRHEDAYTAARNAYLDHFELVEIPLRVRDEGLTLDLEERYAQLRNDIDDRRPVADIRATVASIHDGLDDVERTLSEPGIGAPILAFVFSFITLFREGFEAVLVVAAILGFLASSRNEQYRGAVLQGVGAAGVATAIVFVLTTMVLRIAPFQREMLEAGTTIFATVVLFFISFWLFRRLDHRRWMEFLSAKVWAAGASGSAMALVGVGFTAVFREGFETVLFYQALLFVTKGLEAFVAAGAAVALVVLIGVAFAVFRAGRRLPTKQFLAVAVGLLMALSVAFAGNAVRGLQKAAVLTMTQIEGAPRLPIFLAELTGYHPTVQTVAAQAALAGVYVLGGVWVLATGRRRKRAERARAATTDAPAREIAERL